MPADRYTLATAYVQSVEDRTSRLTPFEREWVRNAFLAGCLAGGEVVADSPGCVRITVSGGVVQEVENLPPGWDYEVLDEDE